MTETLVALVLGSDLRLYTKNGENAVQVGKLVVPAGIDAEHVLSLALNIADVLGAAYESANGTKTRAVRYEPPTPKPHALEAYIEPSTQTKRERSSAATSYARGLEIYEWLVEHGPARRADVRHAFPRMNGKAISNRLDTLHKNEHVTLAGGYFTAVPGSPPQHRGRAPGPLPQDGAFTSAQVLAWLREHGPASRAEMYQIPGMSRPQRLSNRLAWLREHNGLRYSPADDKWHLPEQEVTEYEHE